MRERWDNRIRREDDVRAITALPIIGRIPKEEQSASFRPVIDGNALHGMRAEAFRQLRTNLQFLDLEHDMEALVVTSSLPGEGKTTVAINLALALTDAGTSVCLVDADLRQPHVASYLDLEGGIGLTDVLIEVCRSTLKRSNPGVASASTSSPQATSHPIRPNCWARRGWTR
ncbi:MAG: P-loop NTPase [Ilumatobacteraceae bacterium]